MDRMLIANILQGVLCALAIILMVYLVWRSETLVKSDMSYIADKYDVECSCMDYDHNTYYFVNATGSYMQRNPFLSQGMAEAER